MDYEYKYKKYKKKFKSLNGGFINLDKLNMFLAPSDKKKKLEEDIKIKENEIKKLKENEIKERKKELIKLEENDEKNIEQKEDSNFNTDKILEELKELKLYLNLTQEEKEINKKLNTKEIKNKMSEEIDDIAENVKNNKITIEKGKENTVNLLENVVDDVKSKAKDIIEDLNEKKPKDPLYTVVNCNNKVSTQNRTKIPHFAPLKMPYNHRGVYHMPQRAYFIPRKMYNHIPYNLHQLSSRINHKNLKPLQLNSLYNTKQKESNDIKPMQINSLYNTKQEESNNIEPMQINSLYNTKQEESNNIKPIQINSLYNTKQEESNNIEPKQINSLYNTKQEESNNIKSLQINDVKDLSENKNEEIKIEDKKFDNLEIVNKKKIIDFSKIYKNTYLFAMVLILANFI